MSEKTVAEKLQFKPGRSILMMNAPANYKALLGTLPEGANIFVDDSPADIIVLFALNRLELEAQLGKAKERLKPGGMIWVVYYKGTARVKTDIHRDSINAYASTMGLVGVAMISIDLDWSALRLKIV